MCALLESCSPNLIVLCTMTIKAFNSIQRLSIQFNSTVLEELRASIEGSAEEKIAQWQASEDT